MLIELDHGCWFHINEDDRVVTTGFPDGSRLHAAPEVTEESVARAKALGYQASTVPAGRSYEDEIVWKMTQDHDLIHMRLAQACGKPFSVTLYGVANGFKVSNGAVEREESDVFFATRLMNQGRAALRG